MIRVSNLKIQLNEDISQLKKKAADKLRLDVSSILDFRIEKESLDARKKNQIHFIYTVDIEVKNEQRLLKQIKDTHVTKAPVFEYALPKGKAELNGRPVVVGFGPAGMFAALTLCQMGFSPIVLERGADADSRTKSVEAFWNTGKLDLQSNVQFGEGGAGTFSDGKLTTRSKDLRCKKVLLELAEAGAPEEITYTSKPHIGTDKLKGVVKNIREKIIALGGEVRFLSQVTDVLIKDGEVYAVEVNKKEIIETNSVVLSIGHSARDTLEMVNERGFCLEQKPFAVGVRIEHPQSLINQSQYGESFCNEKLGAADYKLTYRTKSGRSVYTFCMCPGGHVVAASSEEGMVAVNGMSYHDRDGENANSALLVQVFPEDFGGSHPLQGMYFQRELEKKAFLIGGEDYTAPSQLVGDFLRGTNKGDMGLVKATYHPKIKLTDLNDVLPGYVCEALKEAIVEMGKKLKGFDMEDALLTAVESRSSSPVRILRGEDFQSVNVKGVYPTGEGAGYAGGILSAAVDGIAAAEKIFDNNRKA